MTSNVGASKITENKQELGFNKEKNENQTIEDLVMPDLKRTFKPEFLNRLDEIIVFNQLNENDIKEIARRMLKSLNLNIQDIKYSETSGNSNIETDEPCPSDRGIFFEDFRSKRVKAMKIYNKKYTGNPIKVYGKVLINKIKMLFQ